MSKVKRVYVEKKKPYAVKGINRRYQGISWD